jgi:hypothetical protein
MTLYKKAVESLRIASKLSDGHALSPQIVEVMLELEKEVEEIEE